MTYILVDTANTFFRARHVVRGDMNDKVGMCLHVILNSVRKAWKDFDGTHVIFALEGRSWRKDFYAPYKRNRQETRDAMSATEMEEDKLFWETFDDFKTFLHEKTNCTVLQHKQLEADDLIAGFIQAHPNDNHVIISTDGDFAQLIAPNVKQYNGVSGVTTTHEGYFDEKGKPVKDKKTNEVKGHRTQNGYSLRSVCVATQATTYFLHIREYARKAQRIKLVSKRPLLTEDPKAILGII